MKPPQRPGTSVPASPPGFSGNDLVDLVQALSLCRDVAGIMALVRTAARALSGADGVTFVLRDGEQCHYADEDAISPLWKGQRFPLRACISGWVMLEGRPAVIPDIYQDARIPHDAYRPTFVKSLVMVPVRTEDPIAAIGAYWAQTNQPNADVVARMQAIAHSTAVALTNVQLYESLQAALRDAEARAVEAERATKAKSLFLAAISHDLRQPFQTMRLYQTLLSDRITSGVDRKMVVGLGQAMAAGEELLHTLLNVSVLDAGTVTVSPTRFSLGEAMAAVVHDVQGEAEKAGITVRLRPSAIHSETDPILFKSILRNLLVNAIRHTTGPGEVLVAARRRQGEAVVQVWDTGTGISPDQLDSIFEDFVQLNNPERDRGKGLGLGLGIVRRIANLLGLRVTVRSQIGKGSVFSVTVPYCEGKLVTFPHDQQHRLPSLAERPHDASTILVVEDDVMQLTALSALIESWGYTVMMAENADEALALLHEAERLPGMVVSDFRLPGTLNGVQLIARLGNEVRRHLPGIIVTGDTAPDRIREATATGCALLHKPYNPAALRTAITAAFAAPAAEGHKSVEG